MKKIALDKKKVEESKINSKLDEIHEFLNKYYKGHVLITCTHPEKNGNMAVEMVHGEDKVLARYLIESSLDVFEMSEKQPLDKQL